MQTVTITGHADAYEVLTDPRFTVPPLAPDATTGRMGWLRSHVGRFSTGEAHERRRSYAATVLAGMDPVALRQRATALATDNQAPHHVPITALAEALGVPPEETADVVAAVVTVARGYFPGSDAGVAGEAAVAYLIGVFGGTADEPTAARIGILVQACNATAALIANTLNGRAEPPVPAVQRIDTDTGRLLTVELDAALAFGAGPRQCPGQAHARALAEGVVGAVRR
jgi:cytochrome P450